MTLCCCCCCYHHRRRRFNFTSITHKYHHNKQLNYYYYYSISLYPHTYFITVNCNVFYAMHLCAWNTTHIQYQLNLNIIFQIVHKHTYNVAYIERYGERRSTSCHRLFHSLSHFHLMQYNTTSFAATTTTKTLSFNIA